MQYFVINQMTTPTTLSVTAYVSSDTNGTVLTIGINRANQLTVGDSYSVRKRKLH